MMRSSSRRLLALAPLVALGCAQEPLFVNRGDFLPPDYQWKEPKRVDLDGDGRKDLAYYGPDGKLVGAGFDEDHDGHVEVFKKYGPDGKVVEETRDTNRDRVLDQRSTDTNGDGKLDKVEAYPAPPR